MLVDAISSANYLRWDVMIRLTHFVLEEGDLATLRRQGTWPSLMSQLQWDIECRFSVDLVTRLVSPFRLLGRSFRNVHFLGKNITRDVGPQSSYKLGRNLDLRT